MGIQVGTVEIRHLPAEGTLEIYSHISQCFSGKGRNDADKREKIMDAR